MHTLPDSQAALLHLLQLTSPALPVGAYSYSEGIEALVQAGSVHNADTLKHWLCCELRYGVVWLEAAAIARIHSATLSAEPAQLRHWNDWLSALRETEEMRDQSWQMGRSLVRLLLALQPQLQPLTDAVGEPCNYATAFAIAAAGWQIDRQPALVGYVHGWVANLINAGVRLIPLGQTAGQQALLELYPQIQQTVAAVSALEDEQLFSCGWGVSIASMRHETLYSRLFRS